MEYAPVGLDLLFQTFDQLARAVVAYLPTLFGALAVLGSGLALAWLLKVIVLRFSAGIAMLMQRLPGGSAARHVRLPWPLSVILANVFFWLTAVFFLAVSSRILGLPGVAEWLGSAAAFLPRVIAAALIMLAGYACASVARDAVARLGERGESDAPVGFSRFVFFTINLVAVLAALQQLGIELVLVRALFLILVGSACGGMAFAFGMGASSSLDNVIAGYYVRRVYRRGQRLRVGSIEGEILSISPTAVIMDTGRGRALVPARKFNEDVSVLLGQEDRDDGR